MRKALDHIHDYIYLMEVDHYPVVHVRHKGRFSELGFEEKDFDNKIFQECSKKRRKDTVRKKLFQLVSPKSRSIVCKKQYIGAFRNNISLELNGTNNEIHHG